MENTVESNAMQYVHEEAPETKLVREKVEAILPMLNGMTVYQIEALLQELDRYYKFYPIRIEF